LQNIETMAALRALENDDVLPGLAPNPPSLTHHISAPPLSKPEVISVPSLARASSAPVVLSNGGNGRQRFTDVTFDILLGPSQIERSPSSQSPIAPFSAQDSSIVIHDISGGGGNAAVSRVETMEERVERFMSTFGITTAQEHSLVMSSRDSEGGLIHLTPMQYNALHKSIGLNLMKGDTVKTAEGQSGAVVDAGYSDNVNFVEVTYDGNVSPHHYIDLIRNVTGVQWLFTVMTLIPRVAEEVWLRSDIPTIVPQPGNEEEKCCICLESQEDLLKRICERPNELGGEEQTECDVKCCVECFEAHVSNSVVSAKFSIAPVRCPGAACGRRLPMERWAWAARKQPNDDTVSPLREYVFNPTTISSIRCPYCDQIGVLFPKAALGEEARRQLARQVIERLSMEVSNALECLWIKYAKGISTATELVDALFKLIPPSGGGSDMATFLFINEGRPPDPLDLILRERLLPLVMRTCVWSFALAALSLSLSLVFVSVLIDAFCHSRMFGRERVSMYNLFNFMYTMSTITP
jgi:hypothetical protein